MSVSGLCSVCEAAPAQHRCGQCGALVCERHYEGAGVCAECATAGGRI